MNDLIYWNFEPIGLYCVMKMFSPHVTVKHYQEL